MNLEGVVYVDAGDQVIAPAFARWSANRPYGGHQPGRVGASGLAGCSRALVYSIESTPPTNPMTESGLHATGMGSAVHDAIQAELVANPPERETIEVEVPWQITIPVEGGAEPLIVESSNDIERAFLENQETVVEVVEIKTMSVFGFKIKNQTEGPGRDHLTQLGMGMFARVLEYGDEVEVRGRLVYVLPNELKGRDRLVSQPGEFDYRPNRYAEMVVSWDTVRPLVVEEIKRLAKIRRYMDEGQLVPRTIPGVTMGGTIVGYHEGERKGIWQRWATDEASGTPVMVEIGKTWHCGYCDWRDLCMSELKAEQAETEQPNTNTEA